MRALSAFRRLFLAGAVLALILAAPSPARAARTDPLASWGLKRLEIWTSYLTYEHTRDQFLATTAPGFAEMGNELVEINPHSGMIGRRLVVGSYPNRVATSDDGTMAYVAFYGRNKIVQVDLTTFKIVRTFRTARDVLFVEDLDVVPGRNDLVVASLMVKGSSPHHYGVYAYDDGVILPAHTSSWPEQSGNQIEVASASTIYSYTTDSSLSSFWTLSLDAQGVHYVADKAIPIANGIKLAGNKVVTTNGRLIDGSGNVVREYGSPGADRYDVVEPTVEDDRVTFMENLTDGIVAQYKLSTGALIAQRTIPEMKGTIDLVASDSGFAARKGTVIYLLGTGLIPGDVVLPPPPIVTIATMQPITVPVRALDLLYDPKRNVLYASVTHASPTHPDEIVAIDPRSGAITRSVYVGEEPGPIALSDDGAALYIGMQPDTIAETITNDVVRIDVATFSEVSRFALGTMDNYVVYADDIAVQPGHPDTIAVTLSKGGSPRFAGVVIYDHDQRRLNIVTGFQGANSVKFASADKLYGQATESGGFTTYTFAVDAQGVSQVSMQGAGYAGADFDIANGLLWSGDGVVFDPEDNSQVAELRIDNGTLEPRVNAHRIYQFTMFGGLFEYELPSYKLIGRLGIPNTPDATVLVSTPVGLAANPTTGVVLFNQVLCNGRYATMAPEYPGEIHGTPGDDVIFGTPWDDVIDGGGGNDIICGGGGNDVLRGGAGNDWLDGRAGNDELDGGPGTDTVFLGNDAVAHDVDLDNVADDGITDSETDNVRSTNEIILGSPGPDTMLGTAAGDLFRGNGGNDILVGVGGNDRLDGGEGNDRLHGGGGTDVCAGWPGDNVTYGCEVTPGS